MNDPEPIANRTGMQRPFTAESLSRSPIRTGVAQTRTRGVRGGLYGFQTRSTRFTALPATGSKVLRGLMTSNETSPGNPVGFR